MRFRPCIDLRNGQVVQIVGSTLSEAGEPVTNFVAAEPAAAFALRYRDDGLPGGHVIALGAGNEAAALSALAAWPGGMQYGGGVLPENAARYLDAGASHVIVTSYLFDDGRFDADRLRAMTRAIGRQRLVIDLSCRWRHDDYWVVADRWQRFTDLRVEARTLAGLAEHCAEFLVHGVDVEGKRAGIEAELVQLLGAVAECPVTYAGGVRSLADMETIARLGNDRIDASIGSALDLFGGALPYADVRAWQAARDAR
jgi:phosphoribosylformimino-5-aminoimidazole carboxamide ribotide isomerase